MIIIEMMLNINHIKKGNRYIVTVEIDISHFDTFSLVDFEIRTLNDKPYEFKG